MRLRRRSLAVLLGVGAVAAFAAEPAASAASAATEPAKPALDNLVKNSPFGSAASPVAAGGESGQLEFRGVIVDKGETYFSLFEPSTRQSQWVGLNESGAPYTVQGYDSATQTVKVLYRNQALSLTLKRAQVVVQAPPPVASGGPVPTPGGSPAVVSGPAPDEAARLAQVAEEIRRRRALRAQGAVPQPQPLPTNPAGPGGPPQPNRR